jgi:2-amino-4-hydroxy-6-hydroxymethyldihydropteridine diphosphokinase
LLLHNLVIPHPRAHERGFVLRPLADIAPQWVHPNTGRTALQHLRALPKKQDIQPYTEATIKR